VSGDVAVSLKPTTRFALNKKAQLALFVAFTLFGTSQHVHALWADLTIHAGEATTLCMGNHLHINVTTQHVI
jgi:hypothetical protein